MGKQSEICLRCKKHTKRKDSQFCSDRCTKKAAKSAPELIRVLKDHVMYKSGELIVGVICLVCERCHVAVKKSFKNNWHSKKKLPTVVSISMITWTAHQRSSFEKYRSVFS
jgi:hypothetical protein